MTHLVVHIYLWQWASTRLLVLLLAAAVWAAVASLTVHHFKEVRHG